MPWTFAHPAAVIPLRRFCPSHLNLAALAIGALTPDFGYYIGLFDYAKFSHTLLGSVACLPVGLVLLALFYCVRKPVWYLLPQPHRGALRPLIAPAPSRLRDLAVACGSIVLGALTHIVWDSFTHRTGWVVVQVPLLQEQIVTIRNSEIALYYVLQHVSTLVGVIALLTSYYLWLRKRGVTSLLSFSRDDQWRYGFLVAAFAVSLVLAVLFAGGDGIMPGDDLNVRRFVFFVAVYGAALFIALFLLGAIICYAMRQEV